MATVVVVLAATPLTSSMPRDSVVIGASVVSGVISDTAPTKVVLPTPNPPEMTIFTEMGSGTSATPQAAQQAFEHFGARSAVDRVGHAVDREVPVRVQIRHQHPGHAEGDLQPGRDLGHRQWDTA